MCWKAGRYQGDISFQRCLSNPDVLKMVIESTARQFDKDPTLRFASLSEDDGPFWCECPACKAMGATPSARMLTFANEVATANEKKYPDRGYIFLAYMRTLEPPLGMKAHRNVVPMIAPLWQCRVHPIGSNCPDMVHLRHVYEGWQKIAGRTAYYDYTTPGPFNFPGPLALAELLRFEHAHGGIGGLREFHFRPRMNWAMMNWVETKLQWDLKRDPVKLRRQFIEGYYGLAAAPAIEKVYDGIERGLRAGIDERNWPPDDGSGLHAPAAPEKDPLRGAELLKPIVAHCAGDIDAALRAAQTEPEPFRGRVVRDMATLRGENREEF